ncbi:MAG TPA: autotransporter assembly complex family protein [Gammaproteobacteria bacterium]
MRRGALLLFLLAWARAAAAAPHVDVTVDGVDGVLLKNVMAYLSIASYRDAPNLTESMVERLDARAPDEIRQSLQPFGYYGTRVESKLTPVGDGWAAHYSVTLPPPVKVRHVEVILTGAGKLDDVYDQFFASLPYKAGDTLDQKAYEQSKRTLQELAARRGYIDARFTETRLAVNPQERWADITLRFNTGPRYFFGAVSFVQDFMDPAFLERYVRFKPGDPFDNEALLSLQYALNDADYFNSVNVEALRGEAADRRIPVRVTLTPRKRNKYTVGAGYGTDTGPRLTLGWANRRLNGRGHTLSVQTQFSRVMRSFLVNYTVPLSDPASERLVYSYGNSREVLGNAIAYTDILGVSRFSSPGAWSLNQYLQLQHDRSEVEGVVTRSRLLLPGVTVSRSKSDDLILPTRGYRLSADLRGASDSLFSDTSFAQLHLMGKLLIPLSDADSLLLRGEVAGTAVESFNELPISQRFFAGGDQSVRGFDYNSLGVRDANGNNVGGKDLTVGSVEIDHLFGPIFGVAAFVDAGDATNSFTVSLQKGVGAGLRWRTPIGMIRFDVAHPIKRPDLDRIHIHISIGPDL